MDLKCLETIVAVNLCYKINLQWIRFFLKAGSFSFPLLFKKIPTQSCVVILYVCPKSNFLLDPSRQASSSAKFEILVSETLLAAIGFFAYFGIPEPPLLPPPWCCCCRLFVLRNEKGLFLLPAGVVAHLSVSSGGPEQLYFCSFLCLLRPGTRHSALNHSGDLPSTFSFPFFFC